MISNILLIIWIKINENSKNLYLIENCSKMRLSLINGMSITNKFFYYICLFFSCLLRVFMVFINSLLRPFQGEMIYFDVILG